MFLADTLDILIITGELSGDMHAAKLVRELKGREAELRIGAMGGECLREAGAEILVDHRGMGVMGIFEAFRIWRLIWQASRKLKKVIRERRPKLVILVDYSGFNLPMARFAKAQGCHVLYYIAPQVWAWRQGRVRKIRQWVDTLAVIFPFEVDFYRRHKIIAHFVGHPLATESLCSLRSAEAKIQLNLVSAQPVIGLIPGSREAEVRAILPTLLTVAAQLYSENPDYQFVLPRANSIDAEWLNDQLSQQNVPITVTTTDRYLSMQACDIAIAASGTVTLELALLEKPMIIVYKGNPLVFWLAKYLVNLDHAGLPNIIAKAKIVPELLQTDFRVDTVLKELRQLLQDKESYERQKSDLANIHQQLQSPSNATPLSELVFKSLSESDARLNLSAAIQD